MTGRDAVRKCLVWDLDNTVWDGVLLEGDHLTLRKGVVDTLRVLDQRGILHSVVSRNDPGQALAKVREFGLDEFFLHPQIGWRPKSESVRAVAEALGIGLDALAFVDDDAYERAEVAFALPEVLCLDAGEVPGLAERPEFSPAYVTEDAGRRRQMYRAAEQRTSAEEEFAGPQEGFLAELGMRLRVSAARAEDLRRAEELTVRTHQLNATGQTYSYDELDAFRTSDTHELLVVELTDRFGPYGTIGLVLVETGADAWVLRLLLMSCRVLSRGIGAILVNLLRQRARENGRRLLADFVRTDRNRMMYVAYRLGGFREVGREGEVLQLESDLSEVPPLPGYVTLTTSSRLWPDPPSGT